MNQLDQQIKAANASLANAQGAQKMRIDWANAEMDYWHKQAELVGKWIENAREMVELQRDVEKLRQFKQAYRDYRKRITQLQKQAADALRKKERLETYAKKALFVLDGEECSKLVRRSAIDGLLILMRELGMAFPLVRKMLNNHKRAKTMPALGSSEYNDVLEVITAMGETVKSQSAELESKAESFRDKRDALMEKHWQQVELVK